MKKVGKKKGLSVQKKQSITKHKLCKSGAISKAKQKCKRKERRAEKRQQEHEHHKIAIARQEGKGEEPELTGEDMLEMIDKEDLESLMAPYKKTKQEESDVSADSRVKKLLPTKDEDGWIKHQVLVPKTLTKALSLTRYKRQIKGSTAAEEEEEKNVDSGMEDENDEEKIEALLSKFSDAKSEKKVKSVAEILAHRNRVLQAKKTSIGCIAMNIIEDPTKLVNVKYLLSMLAEEDPSIAVTIRKYVCLTILNILHSIIPSYKIQETNIKQNTMKKDTYAVAQQEKELLTIYKRYLTSLEEFLSGLKEEPQNFGLQSVCQTAVKCLGELLVEHSHFNFTVNIIQLLIPYLNHTSAYLRTTTFQSLKQVLRNDKVGYLTLEVVKRVNKLIRAQKFRVKREVVEILLHVRVSAMKNVDEEADASRTNAREANHREKLLKKLGREAMAKPSRKQKKERKKMAKLREEKAGFEAQELMNVVNRKQSDILAISFAIYFHILKNRPNSKLIGIVLEGLARFAHLINVEFFSDLLRLLSDFLERGTLTQSETLHCIQTVFTILFGQGEALTIDPHRFYRHLYRKTFDMKLGGGRSEILHYLKLLQQILTGQRKKVSSTKVMAFTKRLATLTLTLFHQEAIPAMVILRSLLVTFSCTEALLDPSEDGCAGIFTPEVDDPEHSHPAATALWDIQLLQHHYHPVVQNLSKNILGGTTFKDGSNLVQLTKRSNVDLFNDYDLTNLKFKPPIPHPDIHLKAHQNFLISKKHKKTSGEGADDLNFENLSLQLNCEQILDSVEKDASSILSESQSDTPGCVLINGVPYHMPDKQHKKKTNVDRIYDNFDIFKCLIQNISL